MAVSSRGKIGHPEILLRFAKFDFNVAAKHMTSSLWL